MTGWPASEPLGGPQHKLLEDVAAHAGLVLRNVALLEDLRASRKRIVAPTLRIGIWLSRASSGSGTMMAPTFLMLTTPSSESGDSRPVRSAEV